MGGQGRGESYVAAVAGAVLGMVMACGQDDADPGSPSADIDHAGALLGPGGTSGAVSTTDASATSTAGSTGAPDNPSGAGSTGTVVDGTTDDGSATTGGPQLNLCDCVDSATLDPCTLGGMCPPTEVCPPVRFECPQPNDDMYTCEPLARAEAGALQCALTVLAERIPASITVQFAYYFSDSTLMVFPDGPALEVFEESRCYPRELREPAYYEQCKTLPTVREQQDCLLVGLEVVEGFTCGP